MQSYLATAREQNFKMLRIKHDAFVKGVYKCRKVLQFKIPEKFNFKLNSDFRDILPEVMDATFQKFLVETNSIRTLAEYSIEAESQAWGG